MRVLILGAGWSGLLSAAVASKHAKEVLLVERDDSTSEQPNGIRAGTPQARHAHGIKRTCYAALEKRFPGFWQALESEGAATVGFDEIFSYVEGAGWIFHPSRKSLVKGKMVTCGRSMVERALRRRVLADAPGVRIVDRTRVLRLLKEGDRIRGVLVRDATGERAIEADLTINALGAPHDGVGLLREVGVSPIGEKVVSARCAYLSQMFRLKSGLSQRDFPGLIRIDRSVSARTDVPRVVVVAARQENGEFIVTAVTFNDLVQKHGNDSSLREIAALTESPELVRFIDALDPTGKPHRMLNFSNRFVHYHAAAMPGGYVSVGDQVMMTNPTNGFGLASAVTSTNVLEAMLE